MSSNNNDNDNKNNKRKNKNPEKKNNKRINLPIILDMGTDFNSFIEKIPNDYPLSPILPPKKNGNLMKMKTIIPLMENIIFWI